MGPPWYLLLLAALVGARECPDGSICDNESATRALPMITNVACTKQMGCPEEYSCVETPRGGSACCPLDQGTPCQDEHHCCPSGTHCSEDGHSCLPGSNQSSIICPDGASECPSATTCCQLADQKWGCCPMEQATCCNDHFHCCPHNTQCDLEHGTCVSGNAVVPMSKKLPARMKLQTSVNTHRTTCKDGSTCPDGSTCCELGGRSFGCCPLISAVCCGDHIHCCPSGTTCDLVHKKCVSADSETPMFTKIPALHKQATVQCDATSTCPGTTTCCRLPSGEWGCCPFEKAVCCSDHVHCCPNGYTCTGSGCVQGQDSIPWLKKIPALKEETTVQCDATSTCPGTTTCCRLPSGEWGCCPFEKAVCCSDHVHCCPNGYTCTGSGCVQGQDSIPWLKKIPALKGKSNDVPCDPTASCPDQSTCCRLPSGEWGCCPIEKAICCSDHSFCCPSGWRCEQATCSIGQLSLPWLGKTLTSAQVKCDKSHSCPDGTTCCHTEGGGWACCPLEEAVCCSDHLHCCPSGYTCDVTTATCNKPVDEAAAPEPASPVAPVGYVWCDGTHACYDGQTCCTGPGGLWTCCPYTQGVCCPDRVHCCPYGHICLSGGAACSRSGNPRWDLGWIKGKQPTL
ncbi:PREDICTED: granulins [Nanorana parkeri]|uniref:granulins n=1 Tax=Nanorana parkeri TaxID=125878 RepID=UPI0008549DD3|nr:PREDICTED: granulins [Nanorana parkeri]